MDKVQADIAIRAIVTHTVPPEHRPDRRGPLLRLRILESPAFSRIKELGVESQMPLREVLRDYRATAILAVGVVLIVYNYIVTTFSPSYVIRQLGVVRSVPLIGLLLGGAAQTAGILILSRVADRTGTRAVAIWSEYRSKSSP